MDNEDTTPVRIDEEPENLESTFNQNTPNFQIGESNLTGGETRELTFPDFI